MIARVLSLVCLLAVSASAGPILEKPPVANPDTNRGLQSETGILEVADDFALTAAAQIARVDWWGYIARTGVDDGVARGFRISIYDDASGVANALVAARDVTVGGTGTGLYTAGPLADDPEEIFRYSANFAGIALAGATPYWISIQENEAGGIRWYWQSAGARASVPYLSLRAPGGAWDYRSVSGQTDAAFALYADPVPEPSTLALLMSAGLVVLWRRRRSA